MTKIRVTNRKGLYAETTTTTTADGGPGGRGRLTYRSLIKRGSVCGGNDEYIDSQFQKPPVRVPYRSISLAAFLLIAGASLLTAGSLAITGNLTIEHFDRVWPMFIMGFLMFIPGFYHIRIAYCAYKGVPGFSFEDIPEFE